MCEIWVTGAWVQKHDRNEDEIQVTEDSITSNTVTLLKQYNGLYDVSPNIIPLMQIIYSLDGPYGWTWHWCCYFFYLKNQKLNTLFNLFQCRFQFSINEYKCTKIEDIILI